MTERMDARTRAVLRRGAEILARQGWCQGRMFHEDGRVCAVGALWLGCLEEGLIQKDPRTCGVFRPLYEILPGLRSVDRGLGQALSTWNDFVATSATQVIALLTEMAQKEL